MALDQFKTPRSNGARPPTVESTPKAKREPRNPDAFELIPLGRAADDAKAMHNID